MTEVNAVALAFALTVLITSSIAFVLKAMVLAIALDRYLEAKRAPRSVPDFIVATDEVTASIGRVISVGISLAIGLTWTLSALIALDSTLVRLVFAVGIVLQAVIALVQGVRAMLSARRLSDALEAQQEGKVAKK